ncbi:hypothetical protein JCM30394_30150 [Deferrisoma palaeochoriense]
MGLRRPGAVALLRFPDTSLAPGKWRPVLLVAPTPTTHEDWLVLMISSQVQRAVPGFDEPLLPSEPDFQATGLRRPSVVRLSRLAVVEAALLKGALGEVAPERFGRITDRLARWIRTGGV